LLSAFSIHRSSSTGNWASASADRAEERCALPSSALSIRAIMRPKVRHRTHLGFITYSHGPSLNLGDNFDWRRASQPQSRAELARHRNRRRWFRHSFSEHERPNLDLGHERKPPGRRRRGQRQWRPELEGNRVNLTRCSFSAYASARRERERGLGDPVFERRSV
jgi:hypothetical protein